MGDTATDFAPYAQDGVDPDEPNNRYRFPLVSNPYPRWFYITAVVVSDDLWVGQRPTDRELEIIASFHAEYCDHWYGPTGTGWRGRVMERRPFDIDGGANGRILIKHSNGGWGYRQRTWTLGPEFVPEWNEEPAELITVLDRAHRIVDEPAKHWLAWKANHPDLFAGEASHHE